MVRPEMFKKYIKTFFDTQGEYIAFLEDEKAIKKYNGTHVRLLGKNNFETEFLQKKRNRDETITLFRERIDKSFYLRMKSQGYTETEISENMEDISEHLYKDPHPVSEIDKSDLFAKYTIEQRFPHILNSIRSNLKHISQNYSFHRDQTSFNIELSDLKAVIPESYYEVNSDYTDYLLTRFLNFFKQYNNMHTIGAIVDCAPFIYVEHLFYFKILLLNGDTKKDPYRDIIKDKFKYNEFYLQQNIAMTHIGLQKHNTKYYKEQFLSTLLYQKLVSNSFDLSQISDRSWNPAVNMFIDQRDEIINFLLRKKYKRFDFVIDNNVVELEMDLLLAITCIELGIVDKITFHLNILPFFVGDSAKSSYRDDVEETLNYIGGINSELRDKIAHAIKDEKINLRPDLFWNMPFPFKELENSDNEKLYIELQSSDCIFIFGDLRYRRLLKDFSYYFNQNIKELTDYLAPPKLLVRSCKSNVLVGIETERDLNRKNIKDSYRDKSQNDSQETHLILTKIKTEEDCLTSGKNGIIQFVR